MSRYRQTMSELLEQVRQQDFTEGHSDKDFKPYPDWKKTAGGRYPRFKHSQKGEIEVDRYGEWLHSDKSGKTIAFYRNHFPKTNTTGGTSMKLTDYLKKINEEVINEVSDHEVSMARGELEAIADKATQLAGALQGKSDEGNPLEAWVQSKITKAKDYINSVSDYLTYDPDMKEDLDEAMSPEQIKKLKDSWSDIKLMSPEKVKTLKNFLDKYSTDTLMQLAQSGINFVSNMARSVAMRRKTATPKHAGSHKTHSVKEETKTDNEKIADLRVRQMQLQTKTREMDPTKDKTDLEITKNKLDNIQLRMDKIKSKNEEVHPAKALIEAIEAVKNKAEKTGMPYSILKQVYDRGMAAWKGGHRPGTTPQQWALARVNSFVTKSSGTWGGADSDLAKKVRSKK